jgi:hypothetical protein
MVWKPVPTPSKEEMAEFLSEHRRSARFLVDESLGEEVAKQIRELGWNVKYVDEVGLRGHADEDVYAYAHKENRVILTHDDDFMDNRLFPFWICSGVVVIPGASGDENALAKAVAGILAMFGNLGDFFNGTKISIASDGLWMVHSFDRSSGKINKSIYKFPKHGDAMEWVDP